MATTRKTTAETEWVVTLAPETSVRAAKTALTKAGLRIDQVLSEIGVVTGRGTAALGQSLRGIPGVVDVAEQPAIDIGPPDTPIS